MQSPDYSPELIDRQLGLLSAGERAALESRLASDPALRQQDESLGEVFRALSQVHPDAPPGDLIQRVLERVSAVATLRLDASAATRAALEQENQRGRVIRMTSFRDILGVAAAIVLLVGVGVPTMLEMRQRGERTQCAWNLGQIGRGVQAYASVFNDSLPFVGWTSRSSWQPTADPTVQVLPNRRHIYPLLRQRLVGPAEFVCPGSSGVPMAAAQVDSGADFAESRNVSYAYQNMAGVRPSMKSSERLPILGDDNPLFEDGLPLFDAAARTLGLGDRSEANSLSHRGMGQNLLTLGGHSIWTRTPKAGIDGDNVWTLEKVTNYTGREGPASGTDAHLLK